MMQVVTKLHELKTNNGSDIVPISADVSTCIDVTEGNVKIWSLRGTSTCFKHKCVSKKLQKLNTLHGFDILFVLQELTLCLHMECLF